MKNTEYLLHFLFFYVLSQVEDDGLIDKAEVQEEIEAHQHEEYEEALGTYTF